MYDIQVLSDHHRFCGKWQWPQRMAIAMRLASHVTLDLPLPICRENYMEVHAAAPQGVRLWLIEKLIFQQALNVVRELFKEYLRALEETSLRTMAWLRVKQGVVEQGLRSETILTWFSKAHSGYCVENAAKGWWGKYRPVAAIPKRVNSGEKWFYFSKVKLRWCPDTVRYKVEKNKECQDVIEIFGFTKWNNTHS